MPVTIYFWKPEENSGPGHISLETSKNYISFWPNQRVEKGFTMFKRVTGKFQTYAEDRIKEERPEDEKVTLYYLNEEAIDNKYEELQDTLVNWGLCDSRTFCRNKESLNCAGVVHILLDAGNINEHYHIVKYDLNHTIPKEYRITGPIWAISLGLALYFMSKYKEDEKKYESFKNTALAMFVLWGTLTLGLIGYTIYTVCCAPIGRTVDGRGAINTPSGLFKVVKEANDNYNNSSNRTADERSSLIFNA